MASGEGFDFLPGRDSSHVSEMDGLSDSLGSLTIEGDSAAGGAEESSSTEEFLSERRSAGPKMHFIDDDDDSLLVYRWGFNRSRKPRRTPSMESDSPSNEHLVEGPYMLEFNEPLPMSPPSAEDNRVPVPISSGDLVLADGELQMVHAVISVSSLEDIQSVVSQLGLETCSHTKASCHSHGHQTNCCRVAAAHNISLESLDLDTNNGVGTGHNHVNHCCHHPLNRFKRGLAKRSCQFFQ